MPNRLLPAGRGVFLALAAAALTLTLLRPACERWLAHGAMTEGSMAAMATAVAGGTAHGDPATPCCPSVSNPSYAVPVLAAAGQWNTPAGIVQLALVLLVPASIARGLNPRRAPPRGAPSFYLRSTRILR